MTAAATTLGENLPKGVSAGVDAQKASADTNIGNWVLDLIKQFDPLKRLFDWFEQHWPGAHPPSVQLPGLPGAGAMQTAYRPGQGGGGSDLSGNTLLQYVKDTFTASMGEEAGRVAAAIALTEGGLNGARGDNGQSAGVFQFYGGGGQLNNFAAYLNTSLEEAANIATQRPDLAVQYALRGYLGAAIQAGLDAGLSGPELATYAQRYGQVSVSPERAGQSYNSLFGAGGSLPETTVDLSGGISGQASAIKTLLPLQLDLNNAQTVGAQVAAAQAAAQAGLGQIMQGGAVAAGTLGTAQQAAGAQGQQFATVLDALYNSVANGKTSLDTLHLQLI